MAIAQRVAGFSLGQADILRRAMGKKKKSELDKQYEGFSGGMKANGFSDAAVKTLWDILLPFSDYAFNKAHSAAYGVLSYWTAYLKAHFPAEYMAALLTSVGDARDKLALYLNECRRMGIKVLPPDVNESIGYFAAVGDDIRFGLGAVRNVGFNVVDAIRAAREEKGRFESFHDFLKKVPIQVANKRTVESLMKAGAFDSLGHTRRALVEIHEGAVESAVKEKRAEEVGDIGFDFDSLFEDHEREAAPSLVPDRPEWAKRDKLAFEREMLGLYVSDHPLAGLEVPLAKHASTTITELIVVGCHAGRRHRHDRRPRHERAAPRGPPERQPVRHDPGRGLLGRDHRDVHGQGVPGVRARPAGRLDRVVRGRVSMRDDGMNLHAYSVFSPELGQGDESGPVVISLPDVRATTDTITALGDVLIRHRGDTEVRLRLVRGRTARVFELPYPVQVTADLYGELKSLLGPELPRVTTAAILRARLGRLVWPCCERSTSGEPARPRASCSPSFRAPRPTSPPR